MSLPRPTPTYDAVDQSRTRDQIWTWLQKARAKGQDLEIVAGERLIMTDTVTHQRGELTIVSGVPTWTAL